MTERISVNSKLFDIVKVLDPNTGREMSLTPEQRQMVINGLIKNSGTTGAGGCMSCGGQTNQLSNPHPLITSLQTECPTEAKQIGDSVSLKGTITNGTAPFTAEFKKNGTSLKKCEGLELNVDCLYTDTVLSGDSSPITYDMKVTDSCTNPGPQTKTETCKVYIGQMPTTTPTITPQMKWKCVESGSPTPTSTPTGTPTSTPTIVPGIKYECRTIGTMKFCNPSTNGPYDSYDACKAACSSTEAFATKQCIQATDGTYNSKEQCEAICIGGSPTPTVTPPTITPTVTPPTITPTVTPPTITPTVTPPPPSSTGLLIIVGLGLGIGALYIYKRKKAGLPIF